MDIGEIIGLAVSAACGGGLTQFINWRVNKRKASVEVQQSEIEVIASTVRTVYEPIIKQQNDRIAQLDAEVQQLRKDKFQMQEAYEAQIKTIKDEYGRQISNLEKRMLEVSRAVGLKTAKQVRAANGQFVKQTDAD